MRPTIVKRLWLYACLALAVVAMAVPSPARAIEGMWSGWFPVGQTAYSSVNIWWSMSFCCKNKNKNTTYALVINATGEWACGGASIAVEGGCSTTGDVNRYGYARNTGTEGYSFTAWVNITV
jgi:hypothetical protein